MELDEVTKTYRARKTVQEMLNDRGYLVSRAELDASVDEFRAQFVGEGGRLQRDSLTLMKRRKDDPSQQVLVFFPEDVKVGVKPLQRYYTLMSEQHVSRALLVVRGVLTPFARQTVQRISAERPPRTIEVFNENELLVNITRHVLVPRHVLLSAEEKAAVLEKYRLKEGQLPRITVTDPVARYYGMKRGQVVKIIRNSETAGRYVTYRLVA